MVVRQMAGHPSKSRPCGWNSRQRQSDLAGRWDWHSFVKLTLGQSGYGYLAVFGQCHTRKVCPDKYGAREIGAR